MNRKERRRLRPHEVAKVDQVQAGVRELAEREPGTACFILKFINLGEQQCCWCDCPIADHQIPGYVCGGCKAEAVYVAEGVFGPNATGFPLCHRHMVDYRDNFLPTMFADAGHMVVGYDAYDDDLDGGAR